MRDPSRDSRARQRIKIDGSRSIEQQSVFSCSRHRDEDQDDITRWLLEVLLQNSPGVFFQRADILENNHAAGRHHWRCAEERSQCFAADIAGAKHFQIEIARRRLYRGVDQVT